MGEQQLKNIAEPVQVYQVWEAHETVKRAGADR